jgi:hypothetical protein
VVIAVNSSLVFDPPCLSCLSFLFRLFFFSLFSVGSFGFPLDFDFFF